MKIDWSAYRVRLNSAGRTRTEPGWLLDRSWSSRWKDHDLWFVWAGRGSMVINGEQPIGLHPGVCVWARQGSIYEASHDPKKRLGVSYIHFDLVDKNGEIRPISQPLPPQWHEVADVSFVEAAMRRITDLVIATHESPNEHSANAHPPTLNQNHPAIATARQILTGLLMDIDRQTSAVPIPGSSTKQHHHRMVLKIAAMIVEAPHEEHGIWELAREAGYSTDHFSRLFKQTLGMSPQEYVVQARINRAKQLLMESSLSIGEIAASLGYRDVFFFSRQFRAKTSQSPSSFRSMCHSAGF